jgi:formylglycine-generating enzyme required for sulfatase activity
MGVCGAGGRAGDYPNDLDSIAWYDKDPSKKTDDDQTHPVGQKKPNAFGLFDMQGNVWEWCRDYYHIAYISEYYSAPNDGSAWLNGGERKYRVLRGGAWYSPAFNCRSTFRSSDTPSNRSDGYGFRVVAGAP